jgi:hypothetical protein
LPDIGRIKYLELWMVRGLSDLSPISGMPCLERVHLEALKHVTALPDLRDASQLAQVHILTLKRLTNLWPLRDAPVLRDLRLADMPQLRWEHVEVLANHPTLQGLSIGTGSRIRNAEYQRRLGYGEPRTR